MLKVQIVESFELMNEAQMREEMNMTPEQRLDAAFQLIDLAIAFSPNKKLESAFKDDLPWIELHFKNDRG